MRSIFPLAVVIFLLAVAGPLSTRAQCHSEEANSLYKRFLDNFKQPEQQKTAYQLGQEYLKKFGSCPDEGDKKITDYITAWMKKYDAASVDYNCRNAVDKDPVHAFDQCTALTARDPQDPEPYLLLVGSGAKLAASGNKTMNSQAAKSAKTALDLINAGKSPQKWWPFTDKQDATGGLSYYIGLFTYESSPKDAIAFLVSAAKSSTKFSTEPTTYQILGIAYYNGEYMPMTEQYRSKCEGKPANAECDAMYQKVNAALDRVIDADARTVALAIKAPSSYPNLDAIKGNLTAFYKARHDNSDAGLDQLISDVLSKPLP